MTVIFTICSNNYLAQAVVLGRSVAAHMPGTTFLIILVDDKSPQVEYDKLPFEIIPIRQIEPRIDELAAKYEIVELNTCVKPRIFEYLFESRLAERAFYLDPDTKLFRAMSEAERLLDATCLVLTPHILSPIPLDDRTPDEANFLRHGLYNLGFAAMRRSGEAARILSWWRERTYTIGFCRPHLGIFVDQLCMNFAPLFFRDVSVLRDPGYNMAPWNLHERQLTRDGSSYLVNGASRLVLFHFSSFRVDSRELPLHYYNRFTLDARPDLQGLIAEYNEELKAAGHPQLSRIPCVYAEERNRRLGRVGPWWKLRLRTRRIVKRAMKILPAYVRRGISRATAD